MSGSDVIILFGGDGSEHRVSVASAQNVASVASGAALWHWTREGATLAVERADLLKFQRPFERDFVAGAIQSWSSLEAAFDSDSARDRVFFLALHGGSGENGTVQGWLEARGHAFTGSGSRASRLAFDKTRAREAVSLRGIPVAEAEIVDADPASHERLARLFERYGKVVVKPVADGSSHGLLMIESERHLNDALVALSKTGKTPYLAEAFISGRELTVGVIEGEDGPRALPCSEVRLAPGRTFDYEGKYLGRGTEELTPAPVPPEISDETQRVALTAHQAVGCKGYSRTDVIVKEADGTPVFLEINTLPGLTRASFIPQQLEAAGISMQRFLERQLALGRARRRRVR